MVRVYKLFIVTNGLAHKLLQLFKQADFLQSLAKGLRTHSVSLEGLTGLRPGGRFGRGW